MSDLAPGDRILIAKHRATVRYVGAVTGQQGVWVGVEWDDASRGKHDGTTGGTRYFNCVAEGTSASFVRHEKVHCGQSLQDALVARYRAERAPGQNVSEEHLLLTDAHTLGALGTEEHLLLPHQRVRFVLVGEEQVHEKQGHLDRLASAVVVDCSVSHAGDVAALGNLTPGLRELDLTDNLLSRWESVEQISIALPRLTMLNLSGNLLGGMLQPPRAQQLQPQPQPPPKGAALQLPNLRALVLNRCGLTWPQALGLQQQLPNLQELHLCGNGLSSLAADGAAATTAPVGASTADISNGPPACDNGLPRGSFPALQLLNLEDNDIGSWTEVMRLAHLPLLTNLHVSNNPITDVSYPRHANGASVLPAEAGGAAPATSALADGSTPPFAKLESLFLGSCRLDSWRAVDELDKFPAPLRELRLSGNPLLEAAKSGGRYEVIGRVAGLTMLNGAEIRPRERRDSELRYLQNIFAELAEAAEQLKRRQHDEQHKLADKQQQQQQQQQQQHAADALQQQQQQRELQQQHTARHPRMQELMSKYGQVGGTLSKTAHQGNPLNTGMLELKLTHIGSGGDTKSLRKKLPRATTVGAVKMLCAKLFKISADRQHLAVVDGDGGEATAMEDDTLQLAYYSLQPGAELVIQEQGSLEKRQQQAQARQQQQQELEARMQQQLREGDRLRAAAEQ